MKKPLRNLLISLLLFFVFLAGGAAGYFLRGNYSHTDSAEFNQLLKPFYQTWNVIHNQYLEQPVDDVKLMQGAIRGMMDSLGDPYTAYMDPDEYREQNAPLQGEYTGVGAWVDASGDALIFLSAMPGSPAEEAGIQPGDLVLEIDGQDMRTIEPELVLKRILGPAGTTVVILVQREGTAEPIRFEIERALITVPSVESEMLENQLGYVRLYTFSANSNSEFRSAVETLLEEGAQGLIVDLRGNSGGYVNAAVDITSAFLESGTVLIEEWGDGSREEYKVKGDPIATEIPLVILVDGGSASASEIMAGALQDCGRAQLVGTTTYGKGLIQNWIPLMEDSGAIRVTIARWLTPEEQKIQGNGLTPDIEVEFSEEDIKTLNDVQLKAAINILLPEKLD